MQIDILVFSIGRGLVTLGLLLECWLIVGIGYVVYSPCTFLDMALDSGFLARFPSGQHLCWYVHFPVAPSCSVQRYSPSWKFLSITYSIYVLTILSVRCSRHVLIISVDHQWGTSMVWIGDVLPPSPSGCAVFQASFCFELGKCRLVGHLVAVCFLIWSSIFTGGCGELTGAGNE